MARRLVLLACPCLFILLAAASTLSYFVSIRAYEREYRDLAQSERSLDPREAIARRRQLLLSGLSIGGWITPNGIPAPARLTMFPKPASDTPLRDTPRGSQARLQLLRSKREAEEGPFRWSSPLAEYIECQGPCEDREQRALAREKEKEKEARMDFGAGVAILPEREDRWLLGGYG